MIRTRSGEPSPAGSGPARGAGLLPEVIAHRGDAHDFPENTLEAIRSALSYGVRCVEFDIQLTADSVPVLLHDATIERTSGRSASVMEMRFADVRRLDVGEPARFGGRYEGTRIPSLKEVVDLLSRRKDSMAFAEIKEESLERFGHRAVVSRIREALEPIDGRVAVISFERRAVELARDRFPVGWVIPRWAPEIRKALESLRPDYVFYNHRKIPAGRRLWAGHWRWALYDVADPESAPALGRRGADFVETRAVARFARHPLYRGKLHEPV